MLSIWLFWVSMTNCRPKLDQPIHLRLSHSIIRKLIHPITAGDEGDWLIVYWLALNKQTDWLTEWMTGWLTKSLNKVAKCLVFHKTKSSIHGLELCICTWEGLSSTDEMIVTFLQTLLSFLPLLRRLAAFVEGTYFWVQRKTPYQINQLCS